MAFRQQGSNGGAKHGAARYHHEDKERDQQIIHGYLRFIFLRRQKCASGRSSCRQWSSLPIRRRRWFVPFDIRVGRKLTETVALSVEVGVPILRDYPVYDFKTRARLNVTW